MRYSFLLERSLFVGKPLLFTGGSGVGKSVVVADTINKLVDEGQWASLPLSFSAQTSALRTQQTIESKLEKKKKTMLGAPPGKRFAVRRAALDRPAPPHGVPRRRALARRA